MINVKSAVETKYPTLQTLPKPITSPFFGFLGAIFHEKEINTFLKNYNGLRGMEFVSAVFEYLNVSYKYNTKEIENIPSSGRVVIIANHPLGALDAMALMKLVAEVRNDFKIVANDMLMQVPQTSSYLLPVDNINAHSQKASLSKIYDALNQEEAVLIFPSGEVSRANFNGVKDTDWKSGFYKIAKKTKSPILPVHIEAKNSINFYLLSFLNKTLSSIFLPHEMFKFRNKVIDFTVGEMISYESYDNNLPTKEQVKLFKKHLYRLKKKSKLIFATQKTIAHPEKKEEILSELKNSSLLGETIDGKKIYLYAYNENSQNALLKEIGRLRELSFRSVGEGTGGKRDLDGFDHYYKHIVLWDSVELEVVGSYRIGESNYILDSFGKHGFYTHTLYQYKDGFDSFLTNSIELGRSFVQPKYWGSRALDYLWQGIGAYLKNNPHIRYMFGPVSLSATFPLKAQKLLVEFYSLYFGTAEHLVTPNHEFLMSAKDHEEIDSLFVKNSYKEDLTTLKSALAQMDCSIPTLYKQYTELCDEGGVQFLGFGVDPDFNNCVDGFIVVDITKIKESKKERYIK